MNKLVSLIAIVVALGFAVATASTVKTYLKADYMDTAKAKASLELAGFEVLTTYEYDKKVKLPIMVITNDYIKSLANKPTRGFVAGVLRVTVNKADNTIRITNPEFFLKAFLQDDYKNGDENKVMADLKKAFPSIVPAGKDELENDNLEEYHFMFGMPYYSDTNELGEAQSVDKLVTKIVKKAKKNHLYTVKLVSGSTIIGVLPGKRTLKFAKKIGIDKAGVLPWQILVEMRDGKAVALTLDGKYMIALSYPLLTMTTFTTIATVPGAIEKDLKKFAK